MSEEKQVVRLRAQSEVLNIPDRSGGRENVPVEFLPRVDQCIVKGSLDFTQVAGSEREAVGNLFRWLRSLSEVELELYLERIERLPLGAGVIPRSSYDTRGPAYTSSDFEGEEAAENTELAEDQPEEEVESAPPREEV